MQPHSTTIPDNAIMLADKLFYSANLVQRSRKDELPEQEMWGMLRAYNLIRHEALKAASEISLSSRSGLSPQKG